MTYYAELDVEITEVGLEAGTLTQYLTYGLQFAGCEVVCMEARQVKAALSAMRNKTDKNDARGIAQPQSGARQVHRSRTGDPRLVQGVRHQAATQVRPWLVRPEGPAADRGLGNEAGEDAGP